MNSPPVARVSTPGPRLRVRLTPAAEAQVRAGHPWVFAERVRSANRPGQNGDLAFVYDRRDRFLGFGLYDPASPIRLRMLHVGAPVAVDDAWWRARLTAAIARRTGLFDDTTTGYRLVHGENDGWPGLVLDRYADTCVLKLYSGVWLPRLGDVAAWLRAALPGGRVLLRLSRNLASAALETAGLREGQALVGDAPPGPVEFLETGLRFEAEVLRGQKTGFFLDQRENRRRVETLARGRDVLNVFSFTGGFSLYAARGGARSVTSVDLSEHALAGARRNFARNRHLPAVAGCSHATVQAEAFGWLEAARARYDLVILDPPSLARREVERAGALVAYARLAGLGLARLRPGGLLLAASCSAHVREVEFFDAVRRAAAQSGRRVAELGTTGHPPDHPATFAEAHYLKCLDLRVED